MNNKIALVTGGMGGIGTAICQALSNEGATVIAAYNRDAEKAKQWHAEQQEQGHEFHIEHVNVENFASCEKLAERIYKKFSHVDILVNNAGITQDAQLHKMDLKQWHDVLRTNLDSVFNVTRNFIEKMIENKYGRIINISSINGQKGQFGQSNYATAKAGMHGFTKALAQEVARKGITVNTISPGYTATEMVKKMKPEVLEKIVAQIPVGRLGEPVEIAAAVAFLASEKSGFITGANLAINGGQYMM